MTLQLCHPLNQKKNHIMNANFVFLTPSRVPLTYPKGQLPGQLRSNRKSHRIYCYIHHYMPVTPWATLPSNYSKKAILNYHRHFFFHDPSRTPPTPKDNPGATPVLSQIASHILLRHSPLYISPVRTRGLSRECVLRIPSVS